MTENDTQEKEYLTKEKFEEIKKELETLKTTRRKEVAEQLEYAKSLGDLSENAEYHDAREMQANLEDRIGRLEKLLKNAEVVSSHGNDSVTVGSKVEIRKKNAQNTQTYTIVGAEEADMSEGKISTNSPLGHAIMGKSKGENFTFNTPKGEMTFEVVNIK